MYIDILNIIEKMIYEYRGKIIPNYNGRHH